MRKGERGLEAEIAVHRSGVGMVELELVGCGSVKLWSRERERTLAARVRCLGRPKIVKKITRWARNGGVARIKSAPPPKLQGRGSFAGGRIEGGFL